MALPLAFSGTFLGWETGTYCGPHFSESIILTNFLLFPLGNTLGARGDSCGRAIDFLVFLLFCSGRYASGKGHSFFDSAAPMTSLLIHVPAKFYRSGWFAPDDLTQGSRSIDQYDWVTITAAAWPQRVWYISSCHDFSQIRLRYITSTFASTIFTWVE